MLAPSFARIFFKNAINLGLPALECDTQSIEQDDAVEVDLGAGSITVKKRRISRPTTRLPLVMQALLKAGGLAEYLRLHDGLVLPEDPSNHKEV